MNVYRFVQEVDGSGRRFYEEMADRAENAGVKGVFHMLAEDEGKLLTRLQERLADTRAYDSAALDRGVNVFEQLRRHEAGLLVADDVAAYQLALDAERDVVHQYETAIEQEEHPELRVVLAMVADEERRMLETLEQLYEFADSPNKFLAWGEFSNLGEFHNFGRDVDH